ncbi:MAG: hypothetical protein M3R27_14305, partial [Bacteroidota bacterium]|nr:hypothetical protein [Bacteroidota bacterium]
MRNLYTFLTSLIFAFSGIHLTQAQTVDASPENQTICFGASATLTGVYSGPLATSTTSYSVASVAYAPNSYNSGTFVTLSDDSQSGVLPIGFNFCFLGTSYTQFYIGSNGWVAFSPQSTSYTSAAIPSTGAAVPKNCIMGPWQDWHPGVAGGPYINYQTLGVAPNRRLVVSWNNCPMFSCTTLTGRFQIVLYETSNIIENYIATKPNCPGWAGGTATLGIHNAAGTIAYTVPGRNSTAWTATNEGWRYLPNGPATSTINWYVLPSNALVGTGPSVTVTPPACQVNTSYYAQVITSGTCVSGFGTDTVVVSQTVCSPCTMTAGNNGPICAGSTLNLTASTVAGATYAWTGPGGFTSTLQNPSIPSAGLGAAGVYTVVATQASSCNSCTATTTVVVNPIPPTPTPTNNGPVCSGTPILLTTPAVAGATYSWTGPGGFTSTLQNPSIPSATAANGGVYSVTVTVSGCTSPAGTTTVVVKNTPSTPVASAPSPLCEGALITLTTPNVAGGSWSWSGPAGFTSSVRNPPPFASTVAASGTYTVILTVNGCPSAPGSVTVVVNAIPVAPTAASVSICYNTSATLTATAPGPNYEWYDAAAGGTLLSSTASYTTPLLTSTTTYYVQSINGSCIGPRTAVTVTVTPSLTVDAGIDASICSAASYTLNTVSPTGAGFTYSWDSPAATAFSTSPSVIVSPAATTTYT